MAYTRKCGEVSCRSSLSANFGNVEFKHVQELSIGLLEEKSAIASMDVVTWVCPMQETWVSQQWLKFHG